MSKNIWDTIIILFCWFCLLVHGIAAIIGGIFLICYFFHIPILAAAIIWTAWTILSVFTIILLDSNI